VGKKSFEVPDSSLVPLFQLVKRDLSPESFAFIFRIDLWKDNGFLFIKIGNLCLFNQILTAYLQSQYPLSQSIILILQ
jgi:hypothetical protein